MSEIPDFPSSTQDHFEIPSQAKTPDIAKRFTLMNLSHPLYRTTLQLISLFQVSSEFFKKIGTKSLIDHSYFFWESVKTVKDPICLESFFQLYILIKEHPTLKNNPFPLLRLAFGIAASTEDSQRHQILGQLLYLIDHQPGFVQSLRYFPPKKAKEIIHREFFNCLEKTRTENQPEQFSLNIASFLLTSNGTVNTGIIEDLIQFVAELSSFSPSWKDRFCHTLRSFQESDILSKKIETVRISSVTHPASLNIVKTALKKHSEALLTDNEARIVALSALLSPLEQTTASCFASALAIQLLSNRPDRCLTDFSQLLQKGKLIRRIGGTDYQIPFSPNAYQPEAKSSPLLKCWENAIANLSEAEENSFLKVICIQAILYALQIQLGKYHVSPTKEIESFLLEIQTRLMSHIHFAYDPSISQKGEMKEKGGFVLYHEDQKIDTPEAFSAFISTLIDECKQPLFSKSSKEIERANFILDLLKNYLSTPSFLQNVETHTQSIDSEFHLSPWKAQIGENSKKLLAIYFELNHSFSSYTFTDSSCEQRLLHLIRIFQQLPEKEKKTFLVNSSQMAHLRIPGRHACSLIPGHPSFVRFWKKESMNVKTILAEGKKVSDTLLSSQQREFILIALMKTKSQSFLQKMKEISSFFSIKEYRNAVLTTYKEIENPSPYQFSHFMNELDTLIVSSLSHETKQTLQKNAIHFADTNKEKEGYRLHLCFLVNPGTGELEVWECNELGDSLKALNQADWVTNQKWELSFLPDKA